MENGKLGRIGMRRAGGILTIIGGGTSAVFGAVIFVPFVVTGVGWGIIPPILGLVASVLGPLGFLGGIFIMTGRIVWGAYLAIFCGFGNLLDGGVLATIQEVDHLVSKLVDGLIGFPVGTVLGLTLS